MKCSGALGNRRTELSPIERQLVDATARHVLRHHVDVVALEAITPVTLAKRGSGSISGDRSMFNAD